MSGLLDSGSGGGGSTTDTDSTDSTTENLWDTTSTADYSTDDSTYTDSTDSTESSLSDTTSDDSYGDWYTDSTDDSSTSDSTSDSSTSSTSDQVPSTVSVGESIDGYDPDGRWTSIVDLTRLHVKDSNPTRGGTAKVAVELTNRSDEKVSVSEPIRVNGTQVATVSKTLSPGQSDEQTVSLPVPIDASSVTVEMAGTNDTQSTSDYLEGRGISISPSTPEPGKTATLSVTLKNTADQSITRSLPVEVGGGQVDTINLSLGAGESKTIEREVTVPQTDKLNAKIGPASWGVGTTAGAASGGISGDSDSTSDSSTSTDSTSGESSSQDLGESVDADPTNGAVSDAVEGLTNVVSDPFSGSSSSPDSPGASGGDSPPWALIGIAALVAAFMGGYI